MSEISEGASEGGFQTLPITELDLGQRVLDICPSKVKSSSEQSRIGSAEEDKTITDGHLMLSDRHQPRCEQQTMQWSKGNKMLNFQSTVGTSLPNPNSSSFSSTNPSTLCRLTSQMLEYNNKWSTETKKFNNYQSTNGQLLSSSTTVLSTLSTDPSTLCSLPKGQSNVLTKVTDITSQSLSNMQSQKKTLATMSSKTPRIPSSTNDSQCRQVCEGDSELMVRSMSIGDIKTLPAKILNSPSCCVWKVPQSNSNMPQNYILPPTNCTIIPNTCNTQLPATCNPLPQVSQKAVDECFNHSSSFADSCNAPDYYSVRYSQLVDEIPRHNKVFESLHFHENMTYAMNEDDPHELNSIVQDHGYQTEQSTQEDIYSSEYHYYKEDPTHNCLDSSIKSINYCNAEASAGEELYDPSIIVDQLEASVRQQVDEQIQVFHNNLHEVISEQLFEFRELVTVQTSDATNIGTSKATRRISSIDSDTSDRHFPDDNSTGFQTLPRVKSKEQLADECESDLLIQLLTHSNRLCTALTREQFS